MSWSYLVQDFNTVNECINSMISSFNSHYNFTENFPDKISREKYVNTFFAKDEIPFAMKPRNYWQHNLSFQSIINFNSQLIWLDCYHCNVYDYCYLKINNTPWYKFYINYVNTSIYETLPSLSRHFIHHDYAYNYILTSNLYTAILSNYNGNNLNGVFLCYYEPFGSAEIIIQGYTSFNYEFNTHILKHMLFWNESYHLPINNFVEHSKFITYFYRDVTEMNFIKEDLNILSLRISKE